MKNIDELRESIDAVDNEIIELLSKRMEYVKKIGEIKQSSGQNIYRPERERAIINRLTSLNLRNLNKKAIEAIFFEIFSISRNIEKPQTIAFLGPYGTYSHQAAKSRFGSISSYMPLSNIEAVFKEVDNKNAKYGVVPIENNTEGGVGTTLDCLKEYPNVHIVAEIYMDIHHSFASSCENLENIKTIYSHPQGYNQCLKFLEDHDLMSTKFIATKSTALAAKEAYENKNTAAICSHIAANLYNLPIMFEKIEDNLANRTRFLILSDFKNEKTGDDKTSIMAQTDHTPGALSNLLNMFRNEGINLTKLESRPIKKKDFKTIFYIDFEGHIDDQKVKNILNLAEKIGNEIVWLGSYLNGDKI
ncbi:chorismate mutase / prephenate dehydratase [Campylobacter blaseri]|uniref:Bifunctional chorismate mutase/prephenate dehydratase n=1 Tax=Campylobacter blaseri TaxID=2042961 RepID=A0A2P8R155_9BACT|nr:prephenate dehydratase [Campylobacter blaseri]PSM52232.1 chloride transporter [Campylobacter blaseri]PSM53998.1 chloride transporter [Campylobacter blaseri]QKF85436.1 chorismate mutase / prephenate dehydratase [Campylobacter blaseri]